MWKDMIIEEIRKYRNEYAKQFNYNLQVVSLSPRLIKRVSKIT